MAKVVVTKKKIGGVVMDVVDGVAIGPHVEKAKPKARVAERPTVAGTKSNVRSVD